jgi:hypothetical protein
MNLIQIATGAAVISTPLWAMAFMQGDRPGVAWLDTNAIQAEGLPTEIFYPSLNWHDFTNDGLVDVLHKVWHSPLPSHVTVTLFIGLGNGEFSEQPPVILDLDTSKFENFVEAEHVDVNGDGYLDIVFVYPGIPTIFLNTGGTGFRCAGDVDGDGQTRVEDLVGLLEDWGCDNSAQ